MAFSGFPRDVRFTPVPNPMFGRLLEEIDDLTELRCTLRLIWLLHQKKGHPRWVSLAETMLGEPVETANVVWFNKPPRTIHPNHPTPPHQDNYYFKLTPCNVASIWVAIDPIDATPRVLRQTGLMGLPDGATTDVEPGTPDDGDGGEPNDEPDERGTRHLG